MLEERLRAAIRGEVRFEAGYRAMYATDASNYRQVPIAVVLPRDTEDVERAIAVCCEFGTAVLSRGGGTSLAGETCNEAVVLDFTKYMNGIVAIDWDAKTARVQPGCVTDDLRDRAEEHHLTFGPDPATHNRNTLGGTIGNDSCGAHAQMAGRCMHNVEELDILTYDGLRMRVGPTSEDELARIIAGGGRRAEIYARLKALRDRYADAIRARFPTLERRVSGFSLDQLLPENGFNVARALVGTEGTCVTILEATVRLIHSPPHRALIVLGFSDIATAADCVPHCNAHGPIALEAWDAMMFEYMRRKGMSIEQRSTLPAGNAWLLVEFGGETREEAVTRARAALEDICARTSSTMSFPNATPSGRVIEDRSEQRALWRIRESALGATSKIPGMPDLYPGWEDAAVPPEHLGNYLREFETLMREFGYEGAPYGHFGQGCVHYNITFDFFTTSGIAKFRDFVTKAAHICVKYEGSFSGEHGDGQARAELLPIMFGDELVQAFAEFKAIWDPHDKMNPGKVVHPYRIDENLRWTPEQKQFELWRGEDSTRQTSEPNSGTKTYFSFIEDEGSFAYAANRCVGTGICRKHDAGTMCPSYMATKEEAYSTRGRARLLFEMLRGDAIPDRWQNETVKEALDLCLACKACKTECPVNVDMATYKAEFLAHYYEKRRRPLSAYVFGLMPLWARLASLAPRIANAVINAPLTGPLLKRAASIVPQRTLPKFALRSFRSWYTKRNATAGPATTNMSSRAERPTDAQSRERLAIKQRILLWPDTWNNYFHPETAQAAVEVLERAGFEVMLPRRVLCCGRPLYDYGLLVQAKKWLRDILDVLRDDIRAGVYVVGLEPSCVSVFRDELVNFFSNDEDAKRLASQTFLFSEFLVKHAPEFLSSITRTGAPNISALVQQHCHTKAILDATAETALFDKLGITCERPDTGCCGMAGAFGFERAHYDISIAIGERRLLPAVRNVRAETIVVADGFSCREQIRQTTGRTALHPAEVIRLALDQRPSE